MQPTLFLENAPRQTLAPEISYICETYAMRRVEQDAAYYEQKRGGKPATVYGFWSYKIAEFAASQFLTETYGFPQAIPDTRILGRKEKSWDADLTYKNVNFLGKDYKELRVHVKSANEDSISEMIPESFMFQLSNRSGWGGMDKVLIEGDENDLVLCVYNPHTTVQHDAAELHIRAMVPWMFAKNYLENPKMPSLIGGKICLYTRTLKTALGL